MSKKVFSLLLAAALAISVGFVIVVGVPPVIAQEPDEDDNDWTTGPGDPTEWDRYGMPLQVYFTLWSMNDESRHDSAEDLEEMRDKIVSYMEEEDWEDHEIMQAVYMYEMATGLDHTFNDPPQDPIDHWNEHDREAYSLGGNSDISYVPQNTPTSSGGSLSRAGTTDTDAIQDAYIRELTMSPSTTVYHGDGDIQQYVPDGHSWSGAEASAIIDYRVEEPAQSSSRNRETQFNHTGDEVVKYQLAPNWCSWDNRTGCEAGETEDIPNNNVASTDYELREWQSGNSTLEHRAKIEAHFEKDIYYCRDTGGDDDDDDEGENGDAGDDDDGDAGDDDDGDAGDDDDGDDYTYDPPPGIIWPMSPPAEESASDTTRDGDLAEDRVWCTGNSERTHLRTETVTVEHIVTWESEIKINNLDDVDVETAELENGNIMIAIQSSAYWHRSMVGSSRSGYGVTTGYEFFSQRDTDFDTLREVSEDGENEIPGPLQPLEIRAFPTEVGPITWVGDPEDDDGPDADLTIHDRNPADTEPPEYHENIALDAAINTDFSNATFVVFEVNPEAASFLDDRVRTDAMVDGIWTRTDVDTERELEETMLLMEVEEDEEAEQIEVEFILLDSDNEGIWLENSDLFEPLSWGTAEGYIEVNTGDSLQTGPDGTVTVTYDMDDIPEGDDGIEARFEPPNWWETTTDSPAYLPSEARHADNITYDLFPGMRMVINLLIIFGILYVLIKWFLAIFGIRPDVYDRIRNDLFENW